MGQGGEAMIEMSIWGQFLTILVMAFALGMDAFSLGIGMGMKGIRLLDIVRVSFVIACLHIIMPLLGMMMGHYIGTLLGSLAVSIGGVLLVILGIHMVYSSLFGEVTMAFNHRKAWSLLLFALMVSVDAFSVGISLGIFATDIVLTVLMFGVFGGLMSVTGLMVGRKFGHWAGEYGETIGGVILTALGLKFLF